MESRFLKNYANGVMMVRGSETVPDPDITNHRKEAKIDYVQCKIYEGRRIY